MSSRRCDVAPDGPVVGVRCWSSNLVQGAYLRGIGPCAAMSISIWRPGVNEAQCGTPAAHEASAGLHQPTPAEACGCGLYAYHEWDPVRLQPYRGGPPYLTGIVRGWGRMQCHPDGWRAQFAEVLALVTGYFPLYTQRIKAVAKQYGVPVVPHTALPAIVTEFGQPVPPRQRPAERKKT